MPALKRNMDSKQPESEKDLNLVDVILGGWLLAHDLADRAIHARRNKKGSSYFAEILELAHLSEEKLKKFIAEIAEELGLATKSELKEVEGWLEKLKARQKRR